MTKIPRSVKPAELVRALKKEGFVVDRQTGSHARLKHPDGRATSIALHPKPVFHGTLRKILKEVDVSVEILQKLLK
ncbi:hypothetical protein A3A64_02715 [Candidatus Gottesmanbacteria bacterium RIFCSPLOWO2_01_FULL_48_11]|uniref:YcfA family protein n=2 Tax=Candidatus Gottesmaniibacteriota TaxID=1752720 RepID=A0A0G1U079_9BACT|nr:MAG: hypothetical protein UY16_C0027G0019 [Candidatus Gottesmanbacteria bacterium GW2011_GWA2_47_9]OGG27944.1 MAG: hypothetical protein A3A64_02715 [Candidatus Gottesmanbacteria bacterium RIFCSPLOWO2_01_FULL_48_11]